MSADKSLPPKTKGGYVHKGDCRCWLCDTETKPRYLKTKGRR